jgi:hypothetical protein
MGDIEIRTLAGGRVILNQSRPYEGPKSAGDPQLQAAVRNHVETYVGPLSGVFSFPPGLIQLKVFWVAPSAQRRFHTLVTCGLAERPMSPPPEVADLRWAELSICLPPEWPIDPNRNGPRETMWPLEVLSNVARYAHENETWVWHGHTLGGPGPGESFAADTQLACVALGDPVQFPFMFRVLEMADGRLVYLFNMIPIYIEEQRLAMWRGTDHLLDRLEEKGMAGVLDIRRQSVAGRRTWARMGPPPSILPFPRRLR